MATNGNHPDEHPTPPVRTPNVVRMAREGRKHRSVRVYFLGGAAVGIGAFALVPHALKLGVAVVAAVGMILGGLVWLATRTSSRIDPGDGDMKGGTSATGLSSQYGHP